VRRRIATRISEALGTRVAVDDIGLLTDGTGSPCVAEHGTGTAGRSPTVRSALPGQGPALPDIKGPLTVPSVETRSQKANCCFGAVRHDDRVAVGEQVGGEAAAHRAETDHRDGRV
jgi:hypothetical protein